MPKQTTKTDHLERTLEVLGDKWTPLILNDLTKTELCFGQLEDSCDGISPRTLSQRLDKLEREGIVTRRMYCEHPPRYKYQLTKKGQELRSVINKMTDWGARYS